MTPATVLEVGNDAMTIAVMLAAPILLTALALGLVIGMIQAATQIQEMTLSFIPKLLGVFAVLMIGGSWMLGIATEWIQDLYRSIPLLIG